MKTEKSRSLYDEAKRVLVGGVNSPVRAFTAVGGTPRLIKRAQGSKIEDEDGNAYIDYVCSWGALILGSAHPKVLAALRVSASRGTSYGAPTKLETELANLIIDQFPSIQKIRFVNSMLEQGVYLPPSPFETILFSAAHNQKDVARTIKSAQEAFQRLTKHRSIEVNVGTSAH